MFAYVYGTQSGQGKNNSGKEPLPGHGNWGISSLRLSEHGATLIDILSIGQGTIIFDELLIELIYFHFTLYK